MVQLSHPDISEETFLHFKGQGRYLSLQPRLHSERIYKNYVVLVRRGNNTGYYCRIAERSFHLMLDAQIQVQYMDKVIRRAI